MRRIYAPQMREPELMYKTFEIVPGTAKLTFRLTVESVIAFMDQIEIARSA